MNNSLKNNFKGIVLAAAVVVIVAAVLIFKPFTPDNGKLILKDGDSEKIFAQYDVQEGDMFSIAFIHSVNKSEVKEFYEIKEDGIYLQKCLYSAFGAGVATEVEEGQELVYTNDGKMLISGYNRKIPNLSYIVGTVSDHILEINGQQISLRELCGRNSVVNFRYEK